jgi:hypothetical protein
VFAPALVAWVGGPGWQVGVRPGAPPAGWVPLAPREAYVPWYRHSPTHGGRINVPARPMPPPPGVRHGRGPGQAAPVMPGGPGLHAPRPGVPTTVQPVPGGAVPLPRAGLPDRRGGVDPGSPRTPREGREVRDVREVGEGRGERGERGVGGVAPADSGRKTRPDGRHLAREMEAVR